MRKWICMLLCLFVLIMLPVTGFATEGEETNNINTQSNNSQNDTNENSNNSEDTTCTHTYSWTPSGDTHAGTCTLCGDTTSAAHTYDSGTATTPATCTTAGEKTFTCTVCSATKKEPIAATGHSYGNGQKVDDTNHKLTCSGCSGEITEAHTWNTVENPKATCKEAGKKISTCTKCSATKEETISVLTTHTYGAWGGDNENHSRTCSVCGKIDSGKHTWSTGTVVTEATCKEAGVTSYTCSGCNVVRYEDVAKKTTHTYDNDCDDTCNVCEAKRVAAHKFSQVLTKDSSGHWYACLICGEKKEHMDHVPGPAATEQKEQTCLTCGYVMTARLNHVHNESKEWQSDRNGHWHTCSGCEVELSYERHEYGTGCEGCKDCGYVNPDNHIYDGIWELDRFSHWGTCTVCGAVSELQDHIPGPEATKDSPQTCTVCGYVMAEYQEHNHEAVGTWLYNDAEHWRVCECGEKLDVDPHIWDEGVKNKDKTITYNCVMCDEVKVEAQPQEERGFPWMALLVMLVILLVAAFGTLAWILLQPKQKGKFTER